MSMLDFSLTETDRTQLPFFNLTKDARRYFYNCRRYAPEEGADIMVIRELKSGEVRIFGYITGRIRFDTQPILEHLEAVLGPPSAHRSESMEDIRGALESFDGIDYVAKTRAEQALPLVQVDYRTCSAVLDRLIALANGIEVSSKESSNIATRHDRYLYPTDEGVRDIGSWTIPTASSRSLDRLLDSLIVERFREPETLVCKRHKGVLGRIMGLLHVARGTN